MYKNFSLQHFIFCCKVNFCYIAGISHNAAGFEKDINENDILQQKLPCSAASWHLCLPSLYIYLFSEFLVFVLINKFIKPQQVRHTYIMISITEFWVRALVYRNAFCKYWTWEISHLGSTELETFAIQRSHYTNRPINDLHEMTCRYTDTIIIKWRTGFQFHGSAVNTLQ